MTGIKEGHRAWCFKNIRVSSTIRSLTGLQGGVTLNGVCISMFMAHIDNVRREDIYNIMERILGKKSS